MELQANSSHVFRDLRNLSKVHFVRLVLRELAGAGEHRLDCAGGQGMFPLHDKLVSVAGDQLDVHGLGALAAAIRL